MTVLEKSSLTLAEAISCDGLFGDRRPHPGLVLSVVACLPPDVEPEAELCLEGKLVCPSVGALEIFYPGATGPRRLMVRGIDGDATRALLLAAGSAQRLDLDGPEIRERMANWDDVRLTGTLEYGPSKPGLLEPVVMLSVTRCEVVSSAARSKAA